MSEYLTIKNGIKVIGLGVLYGVTKTFIFPSKQKSVEGKIVLITGSATGLGRATAIECGKRRVKTVVLWDIQKEELEKTEKMVKEVNNEVEVIAMVVNVADREVIYRKAKELIERLGGNAPDVVVNNAGIISGGKGLLDTMDERIELEIKINTLAHVWMTKAFMPKMIETKKGGHFVNIASMAAYVAAGDMVCYAMSKKGAKGFAEGLNDELRLQGLRDLIKISLICPSHIDTALFKGFSADGNITMTPEYVAKQIIEAVECNKELVQLPKYLAPSTLMIGVGDFFGKLNTFPSRKSLMKSWTPNQANKLYDTIAASTK